MFDKNYLVSIFAPFASPPRKKKPHPPSDRFLWTCNGQEVRANNKCDAKAKFKRLFGVKSLHAIVYKIAE